MAESKLVRGHTCAGLAEHFAAVIYGCIPRFGADGTLVGCDDTNPTRIAFCPYCGERLAEDTRASAPADRTPERTNG